MKYSSNHIELIKYVKENIPVLIILYLLDNLLILLALYMHQLTIGKRQKGDMGLEILLLSHASH